MTIKVTVHEGSICTRILCVLKPWQADDPLGAQQ